jgi:hypothetical protein
MFHETGSGENPVIGRDPGSRALTVRRLRRADPIGLTTILMFTAAKDALASQAARRYVNGLIKRYGEVSELKINSKAKSVDLVCLLIGENEPVTVRIDHYRVENHGGKHFVELGGCSCSRLWLQNLLEDHACGRRFGLPGWAAAAL